MTAHIRTMTASEWPAAMALTARAFVHEPFITKMCGDDVLERYARAHAYYAKTPYSSESLGAFSGSVLLGCIGIESAGCCHHCAAAGEVNDATTALYQRNATRAHLTQPPHHGWIGRVAVEPTLHGSGVGGQLVTAALTHLAELATPIALLDCEPHRTSFYTTRRFVEVDRFAGSFNNTIVMMAAPTGAQI